jgi:hypothetical protein
MIGAIQRYHTNPGAQPLPVHKTTKSSDGAGAQDAAPDALKSPPSDISASE